MRRTIATLVVVVFIGGCGATAAPSASAPSPAATSSPRSTSSSSATATPAPTATPTPTPTPIAVLPGEPWLAYQSDQGGGKYGIRLVRLDGNGVRALAPDVPGQYQLHPDWSPDGQHLVFAEVGYAATDLWTIDADGQNAKHIVDCTTGCTLADEPAWSPDGTTVAFHRQAWVGDTFVSTLELYDVAGGTARVLLTAADDRVFFGPRWGPDGRIVVEYVHRTTPGKDDGIDAGQIVIVDTRAAHPTIDVITKPGVWVGNPEWSPDGRTIVAFRPETFGNFDGPADLWSMHPDGSGLARLTNVAKDGGQVIHPAWSSDSSRIAFSATTATLPDGTIATIAADGSDLQAIAGGAIHGLHPRLRPVP